MNKCKLAVAILAAALIGTNAWWVYHTLDAGVLYTYQGVALEDNQEALQQALAVITASSIPGATKETIIAAAQGSLPASDIFEKEGYIWVGRIGLRFNETGQLLEATPAWN